LRGTGYIEKEELREMVLALLDESDLSLSDTTVQAIVDNVRVDIPLFIRVLNNHAFGLLHPMFFF
jgi:hypothetical protein